MAEVVHNAYDAETMSITVSGEPGTDEAETFLRDKLCEQGLKSAPRVAPRVAGHPSPARFSFVSRSPLARPLRVSFLTRGLLSLASQ